MSTTPNNKALQEADASALQEQLAAAYPSLPAPAGTAGHGLDELSAEDALSHFHGNPVAFVRKVVDVAALDHLQRLKEESELRGALTSFRNAHPDSLRFEPFILQEVAELIQNDASVSSASWSTLLEKGLARFREKFKAALKDNPDLTGQEQPNDGSIGQMENAGNRKLPKATPAYTRKQIGNMSLPEFIAQEEAINEALKNNRIR